MSFLSQMATIAGGAMQAGVQQQQAEANVASTKASTAYNQMMTQMMQRKMVQEQDLAKAASYILKNTAEGAQDPLKKVQAYEQLEQAMLAKGNMSGAEEARKGAAEARLSAKAAQVMAAERVTQTKEAAASAASAFISQPTQSNAEAAVQAAIQAGVKPETIPQPGTAAFVGWAQSQRKAALSAKESLDFEQKVKDQDERREEQVRRDKQAEADRQERIRENARLREEGLALRRLQIAQLQESREARLAAQGGKSKVGSIEIRQTDNIIRNASQIDRVLGILETMPTKAAGNIFAHLKDNTAIDAFIKTGGNVITPELDKALTSSAAELGVITANIITAGSGRGGNKAMQESFQHMTTPAVGDSPLMKVFRLANVADITRRELENLSEAGTPQLEKNKEKMLESLNRWPDPRVILSKMKGVEREKSLGLLREASAASASTPRTEGTPETPALPPGWGVKVK